MTKTNEEMAEYMRERHKKHRARAIEYLGGSCRCGSSESLHFHHTDPETKGFTISSGLSLGWERLVVELDKCVLLCESCHQDEHRSTAPHGTAQRYWRGCRCTPCRQANTVHSKEYKKQVKSKISSIKANAPSS
jgi:hypothetical protein